MEKGGTAALVAPNLLEAHNSGLLQDLEGAVLRGGGLADQKHPAKRARAKCPDSLKVRQIDGGLSRKSEPAGKHGTTEPNRCRLQKLARERDFGRAKVLHGGRCENRSQAAKRTSRSEPAAHRGCPSRPWRRRLGHCPSKGAR